ncbi:hypothetical protein B9Z55_007082 [Caenorhabditis nigoni]|uniref:BTB domain-containing protein n=1 Tax=Caenorhabditis nigoni TaxID=1611254 RepID=A0A2G5V7Z4_9PELO|nr:hypothetical protein B9Z55_007082 [Caenorhabditis nigoni]
MPSPEKTFVLKHVFKNVSEMKEGKRYYAEEEKHFGVPWRMYTLREDNNFGIRLNCSFESEKKWSIQTSREVKLSSVNGQSMVRNGNRGFGNMEGDGVGWGWCKFIEWDKLIKNFVTDDSVVLEIRVKIEKMAGIKLRDFDESNKSFSDVVLIVENQKFYVSKLYLASQSTYFNTLLLGKFEESTKSEIEMKDVKSEDFQKLLEVLYGESSIDESTIEGILQLADMFDAKLAIGKCEEFLMENSGKTLKEKLELAYRYSLQYLKNKCMSEITTVSDIRSVLSNDPDGMDPSLIWELLQKSISLDMS